MATADDDGYLYLVDRAKDLVIVSGFNVYPAEVEHVLGAHPDVLEVGVVGVPHPHTGEAVKAFVVARPGADVDEETLIEHCLDHLSRYKCPSKILFVKSSRAATPASSSAGASTTRSRCPEPILICAAPSDGRWEAHVDDPACTR